MAWREASMREIKVIACQECFPGMGQWTIEERDFVGKDPVCGNCRGKLERAVVEEMKEDVTEGDVTGMFLREEMEEEDFTEGEVIEVSYETIKMFLSKPRLDGLEGGEESF